MKIEDVPRYLVFGFETYYPGGGINDLIAECATYNEAVEYVGNNSSDNYEIVDRWTMKVVTAEVDNA